MTILVVDDEPDFLATCVRLLALMGHEAVTAANALDALSRIDAGGLDLVITDMRLGRLDGRVIVERAQRADPRLPVIVVTGCVSPEAVEVARRAHAVLLPKPLDPVEFRLAIQRSLGAG